MIGRNRTGLFWTIIMPVAIYVGLSVLPIGTLVGTTQYKVFLLPGIIALTIMQGGIYTFAYWLTDLRNLGVLRQISATPVNKLTLVYSMIVSRSIVMIAQAIVLTAVGEIFFDVDVRGSVVWGVVLILLGGSIFLPIGMLIASFADNYDAAAPITAGIGLPLTFLGNVFYPIQLLPHYLQAISSYLPLTFLADALRMVFLHSDTFFHISTDLLWLLAWGLVVFIGGYWRFQLD